MSGIDSAHFNAVYGPFKFFFHYLQIGGRDTPYFPLRMQCPTFPVCGTIYRFVSVKNIKKAAENEHSACPLQFYAKPVAKASPSIRLSRAPPRTLYMSVSASKPPDDPCHSTIISHKTEEGKCRTLTEPKQFSS